VVKVGGGLLAHPGAFHQVTAALASQAVGRPVLLIPGGGPFADAVREMVRGTRLSDDTAHWMAVLAMDQFALALGERIAGAVVVESEPEIGRALAAGRVPVLAPSRWLKRADPLPHSWEVTSDSIAAWVAGAVHARRLVLIKPAGGGRRVGAGAEGAPAPLVDPQFLRVLPRGVEHLIITVDDLAHLGLALGERGRRGTGAGGERADPASGPRR
jgi:aspartokinase-like uncharacterized kinase